MTYTHLTPNELVIIEAYFIRGNFVLKVAILLKRSRQTINKSYTFQKIEKMATDFYQQYH